MLLFNHSVVSDSFVNQTDNHQRPELNLFIDQGSDEKILIEQEAHNTGENFSFSKKLLTDRNICVKSGLIVCKPYMSARTLATAQKQWCEVNWRVCAPPIPFKNYCREDMPPEQEIQLLTGDLQRLRVYANLGYQVPVEVPDEIWAAFERLVQAGFDQYYIH